MTIKTIYLGNYQTKSIHIQSKAEIITDADRKEEKISFSSSDMLIASLGSCILTVMETKANKNNFSIANTEIALTKIMSTNPKRISDIIININIVNNQLSEKQKETIESAAKNCPVGISLHPDINQQFNFNYK